MTILKFNLQKFVKNISFFLFIIFVFLAIFDTFIDYSFLNYFLYTLLFLFLYLLLSVRTKSYKISYFGLTVTILFLLIYFSYSVYHIYYKRPSKFISYLIYSNTNKTDNNITKDFLDYLRKNNLNLDILEKENFKKHNKKYIYKNYIHGKRYNIVIHCDDNTTTAYLWTGYNAVM